MRPGAAIRIEADLTDRLAHRLRARGLERDLDGLGDLHRRALTPDPEQPLLDIEGEQLLPILQHGIAAGLTQRIGNRPRGDIDVQAWLTAQHEARHERRERPR